MTGRRNIIIAISAIVVFAAVVGFFITLDVSPQIAYARLFIDAGLAIGLIAVVMAFYREPHMNVDGVINALRSLKNGLYKTRVQTEGLGQFQNVAVSINELAQALEVHHEKQEEIKRNLREELLPGLKQKEPISFDHSIHPELGPVLGIPPVRGFKDVIPEPFPTKLAKEETKLSNALVDSKPPKIDLKKLDLSQDFNRQTQDLGELYQRFIDAQRSAQIVQTEYQLFLRTIERTKEELMTSYKCQGILFDIVKEADQVALQPKIIR